MEQSESREAFERQMVHRSWLGSGLLLCLLISRSEGFLSIKGSSWLQNLRQETWLSTQKVEDRGVDNVSNNITDKNGTIWNVSDLDNDDTVPMPVIVGIAGGSGSGKTTLTQAIMDALGHDRVTYISHDSYYKVISPPYD